MWRWAVIAACFAVNGVGPSPAFASDVSVSGEIERYAAASREEKLEFSVKALSDMRTYAKEITRSTETARRDGEVELLQCLTNRLTSLRALLQVSESADLSMRNAFQESDADLADHEFRKIIVAHSKSVTLSSEAARCSNDQVAKSGDTSVRVDAPIEGGDGSGDVEFSVDVGFDAPQGSPFN